MKHFFVYLFVCLWVWAPLAQLRAIPLHVFLGGGTSSSDTGEFSAGFNGTTQYMRLTSTSPTGWTDGKAFTCAFWIDLAGGDAAENAIINISNSTPTTRFSIARAADNTVSVFGRNAANTTILSLTSTSTLTASAGWTHIYICINLANAAQRKIYINGVSETLIVTTYTDDTLDLLPGASSRFTIGASGAAASLLNGSLSEFWMNDAYLDDPTKFYSGGNPVDLGVNGATPTGSQPPFYFSETGSGDSWATNAGGAGTMSVTGSPLSSPTGP